MYYLRFAHPWVIYGGLPLLLFFIWLRLKRNSSIIYTFPLVQELAKQRVNTFAQHIPFICRTISLTMLLLLIAQLQKPDVKAPMRVDGIDIMLAIDVSGSMQYVDDAHDERSRVEVAKDEAIKFLKKRDRDQVGLVIFARDCLSRCPLTLDKNILQDIVEHIELGMIDPNGTLLCTGMALAINRLRDSKAASKILIVLTDGAPSEGDLAPEAVIKLAKKFGIKIYTIGIGGDVPIPVGGYTFGYIPPVNKKLLHDLAAHTGGSFFEAKKPQELHYIYDLIDSLETTSRDTEIYSNYQEIFFPLALVALLSLLAEVIFATLIWFKL